MKNFYLTLTALLFTVASYAATITAVTNGTWATPATWDLNRAPAAGDLVVIPAGINVTVGTNITIAGTAVMFQISGNLILNSGRLWLPAGSEIRIYTGGSLSSTGSASENIRINGNTKYQGNTGGTINGPVMATETSAGFTPMATLPVKFIAFNVTKKSNDYHLSWSTSEEVNSYYYEVERSEQGVVWKTVARIQAAGNSSNEKAYSYTDRNVTLNIVHYRIKQADLDGRVRYYTTIKTFHNENGMPVYVASDGSMLSIRFTPEVKGAVDVNLISMNGQSLIRKSYAGNPGNITLSNSRSLKGTYLVQVRYNNGKSFTKQVIF